jgi:hypothetical protein
MKQVPRRFLEVQTLTGGIGSDQDPNIVLGIIEGILDASRSFIGMFP